MGAALFGYLGRLAVITTVVLLVKDAGWVELVPLGFTIILTHLGLPITIRAHARGAPSG